VIEHDCTRPKRIQQFKIQGYSRKTPIEQPSLNNTIYIIPKQTIQYQYIYIYIYIVCLYHLY
jgi:hypothetical protein